MSKLGLLHAPVLPLEPMGFADDAVPGGAERFAAKCDLYAASRLGAGLTHKTDGRRVMAAVLRRQGVTRRGKKCR